MRVLIHMGDPYEQGPNAKRMRTFCEAFRAQGHTVKIIAPYNRETVQNDSGVYYAHTFPLKKKTSVNRFLNQIVFGCTSFFVSLKAGKTDVVISTCPPALIGPFGWLIAKYKGAKLVYDVRDIWPDVAWQMKSFSPKSLYSHIFVIIRDFMLKHSDLITAASIGKVARLKAYQPQKDIAYITNGLDGKFLQNEIDVKVVEKYHLQERFTCVYHGNLGMAQGLIQLLMVADKAKKKKMDVQFLLFGSGVEENQLKEYVYKHKLDNVFFPGKIENNKIYTVLSYAKMCFISLVNEKLIDSVPTKMFEALGVGCPVLLAAVGDAADILNETGLGIAVPPNRQQDIWNAFETLHDNYEEFVNNYKDKAVQLMKTKYSRQYAADLMEAKLSELVRKKGKR